MLEWPATSAGIARVFHRYSAQINEPRIWQGDRSCSKVERYKRYTSLLRCNLKQKKPLNLAKQTPNAIIITSALQITESVYVASDADSQGVTVNQNVIKNMYVYTSYDQQHHMQGFKFVLRCLGQGLTTVVRASLLSTRLTKLQSFIRNKQIITQTNVNTSYGSPPAALSERHDLLLQHIANMSHLRDLALRHLAELPHATTVLSSLAKLKSLHITASTAGKLSSAQTIRMR